MTRRKTGIILAAGLLVSLLLGFASWIASGLTASSLSTVPATVGYATSLMIVVFNRF